MAAGTVTDSEAAGYQAQDSRFTLVSNGSRFQPGALDREESSDTALATPRQDEAFAAVAEVAAGAPPASPYTPGAITMDRLLQIEAENNDRGFQAARSARQQQRRLS